MDDVKTVGSVATDLYAEQAKHVQSMRTELVSFQKNDPAAAFKAIKNITILRVYHQLSRIVKYTELMDRLEDRIYESINMKLDNADPDDEDIYFTLIPIQERLQRMMIESHKLLEPYLNLEQLATFEVPQQQDPSQAFTSMILDQESREKVRTSAQELLAAIATLDEVPTQEDTASVQSKAAEALAKLDKGGDTDA